MTEPRMQTASSEQPGDTAPGYDIVAIGASAGGVAALQTVVHAFPPGVEATMVVMLHLGQRSRALVDVLARRAALPVSWAEDGAPLQPGHIYVCPPNEFVEVNPDRSFTLTPGERGTREYPINALFGSMAQSFQERGMAVVLTGMLNDGAEGARAVKQAGGTVIVQSEESAEYPSMPHAAVETGAVDLVLPLNEIGPTVADLISGRPLPRPRSEREAILRLFAGEDEVARLLRQIDWARTPLGPVADWPAGLQTAVRMALDSPIPECILWGPDQIQLYNDRYQALMGDRRPSGLGKSSRDSWPEAWHLNEPIFERVRRGEAVALEDALFPITRHGVLEDAWFNLYFTPIRDERNAVAGIRATVTETTAKVLAARRLAALHDVAEKTGSAESVREALERSLAALEACSQDVPFAVGYLLDAARMRAQLVGAVGTEVGGPLAPQTLGFGATREWPLAEMVTRTGATLLEDLSSRFRGTTAGPQRMPVESALLVPLRDSGPQAVGLLVLGISARLPLDAPYREFLELLGQRVSAALVEAANRYKELERLEALADLDRVKTEFFANISHEFRTPLTLMLAPLEEATRDRERLPPVLARDLDTVTRNARRLLRLVESLLDISQAQAGRLRARFEPVDLAALTTDLASLFRSAVSRAGLRYVVDCGPLAEPAWVDVAMWEKIVSNLLANALKFTFEGEICLRLKALPRHVELQVSDTGVGIPEEELPHIFKRFHQVQGTAARTHEGAGIGLALVHELVRLHRGRMRVKSTVGKGSIFTLWLPLDVRIGGPMGRETPPQDPRDPAETSRVATALAEQARTWVETPEGHPDSDTTLALAPAPGPARPHAEGARVLVVDDNADMRAYLVRLLSPYWRAETAAGGAEALAQARRNAPDLLLADVMMPRMDGFELLKQFRADEQLATTPVILVTARVGEEAAIEGLLAGADDYVAKPFSARELIVRIGAQLELARVRRESETKYRALVNATSEVVYRMSPDWSEMRELDGRGFIADTVAPTLSWLEKYILPEDQPHVLAAIREAIRTKSLFELEHRVVRADGTPGWTLSRAVPLLDEHGEIVEWFGAASDITARKRAEAALAADLADTTLLRDLADRLVTEENIQEVYEEILSAAISITRSDAGTIQVYDPQAQELVLQVTRGFEPKMTDHFQRVDAHSKTACGIALETGARSFVDFDADETDEACRMHVEAGYLSAQSTPLVSRNGTQIGMLNTHWLESKHRPTERELRFLDLLARQAADLIERRMAEEALRVSDERP